MRTVLHIFLKDVRQMRWTLAVWLALLAVQFASALSDKQTLLSDWSWLVHEGPKLPVWTLLHWLGLVVVVFEVLLADRPFGTGPVWKTRPIARWQMAVAKLLFIIAFTVLLPTGLELIAFLGNGVAASEVWLASVGALLLQSYVVSWLALSALFGSRRSVVVVGLAAFALVAPFGWFTLCAKGLEALIKASFVHPLFEQGWERPPDFLAYPTGYHMVNFLALGCVPVLAHYALTWQAYRAQSRWRAHALLVLVLSLFFINPAAFVLRGIAAAKPVSTAPQQRLSAEAAGLALTWKRDDRSRRPFTMLEATRPWPDLPSASGADSVVQPWNGFASLRLTKVSAGNPNAYRPHFALPEQNPKRYSDHVAFKEGDKWLNGSLAREGGPLAAWLGKHTLLNPAATQPSEPLHMGWQADRPLTNFTHTTVGLRVATVDSRCSLVQRLPFTEFRARNPVKLSETTDVTLSDPRYTIITESKHVASIPLGWPELVVQSVDKAILWHPKRRELLLPETVIGSSRGKVGVIALPAFLPMMVHTHTSHFPHTPSGKQPPPGAPGPEWFAEAEVLLLAFKPVATRHHVIVVPDVKLPSASPPPKP